MNHKLIAVFALPVLFSVYNLNNSKAVSIAYQHKTALNTKTETQTIKLSKPLENNRTQTKTELIKLIDSRLKNPEIISLFKGEKGDMGPKGEPGERGQNLITYNPENTSNQAVYIPSTILNSDLGTLFSATTLTSEVLHAGSINAKTVELSENLNVQGESVFSNNSLFATTTIENLIVKQLSSDSGAYLSSGGAWVNASSEKLKENFTDISNENILEKLNQLKIERWNYKNEPSSITHVGPTAENFYKIFQLGGKQGETSISTIDPSGIALLSAQKLYQMVTVLKEEINQTKKYLENNLCITQPLLERTLVTSSPETLTNSQQTEENSTSTILSETVTNE